MKILIVFFALSIPLSAYPCSMFLEDNIHWGKKVQEFERAAIIEALESADSVLVVRVLDHLEVPSDPTGAGYDDAVEPEIILNGPNPRAGNVRSRHRVKILNVLEGAHQAGDVITVDVLEPERIGPGECGDPDPTVVTTAYPMDRTFKYLIYLKGNNVLRRNLFIEWYEPMTAESEIAELARVAGFEL